MKPYKSDWQVSGSVLLVSADKQDHPRFQKIVQPMRCRVGSAGSCDEAVRRIRRDRPLILICDVSLPDGSWKDLLSHIAPMPDAPLLIVISTHADDHLWSEVLNLGGYDVLSKPLADDEVLRVISLACQPTGSTLSASPN
jgi:two-component system, OmpR family, response regulator CpxR